MSIDISQFMNTYLVPLGWKLIGAVVIWIVGGWLINLAGKAARAALGRRKTDLTLAKYAEGGVVIGLRILLVVAILGMLGIETTSFAALLAAAGIAVGAAWAGLLANFAAGVFLVFLRPFKVGDMISAGGVTGTVVEIGLFATLLDTEDNIRVFVGNNTIFSANIQNYSTNSFRRVDLTAQIGHDVDPSDAIERLQKKLNAIPNVLAKPAAEVHIQAFNERGALLAVQPNCHNDHYWQVYFDTNRAIVEVGAEAGYQVPEQRVAVRNVQ
ncbi:MAG: mechanosensitive ion channel family protein [Chloroflexota bacterium]